MTRRTLCSSLAALVPGAAVSMDASSAVAYGLDGKFRGSRTRGPGVARNVELEANLRPSNASSGKNLLEIRWKRPEDRRYAGAIFEALTGRRDGTFAPSDTIHYVDDVELAPEGEDFLAVLDATALLAESETGQILVIARSFNGEGEENPYVPGQTPEVLLSLSGSEEAA
jgi:hypothetical protein